MRPLPGRALLVLLLPVLLPAAACGDDGPTDPDPFVDDPPTLELTAPATAVAGDEVAVTLRATDDREVTGMLILWGDTDLPAGVIDVSGREVELERSHTYAFAGAFTIQARATDDANQHTMVTREIEVTAP